MLYLSLKLISCLLLISRQYHQSCTCDEVFEKILQKIPENEAQRDVMVSSIFLEKLQHLPTKSSGEKRNHFEIAETLWLWTLVSSSEEICISSWDTSDKEDGLTMQFWRTLQRFPSRLDFI